MLRRHDDNVRSIGGITVGNGWMRNNPDLIYPEGVDCDALSDEELLKHIKIQDVDDDLRT